MVQIEGTVRRICELMGTVATKSACGGGGARYGEAVVVDVPAPVEPLGVYPDGEKALAAECRYAAPGAVGVE